MSRQSFSEQVNSILRILQTLHIQRYGEDSPDMHELNCVIDKITKPSALLLDTDEGIIEVRKSIDALEIKHNGHHISDITSEKRELRDQIKEQVRALKSLLTEGSWPAEFRRVFENTIKNRQQIFQVVRALNILESGLESVLGRSTFTHSEFAENFFYADEGSDKAKYFIALRTFADLYKNDPEFKAQMTVQCKRGGVFHRGEDAKAAALCSEKLKLCFTQDAGLPRYSISFEKVAAVVDAHLAAKQAATASVS